MILASVRAATFGILLACVAVGLFAILSGFALSEQRLAEVVRTTVAQNEFAPVVRRNEERFTECLLLVTQRLRSTNIFHGALDTKFLMRGDEHPCDTVVTLVLGPADAQAALPAPHSYFNYPFGNRHLMALSLSALDYGQARRLYSLLSYGSLVLLFLVMLWRARGMAIVIVPLPLLLMGAFSMHRLGGNLAHAPGYFIGFLALTFFLAKPTWFDRFPARLGFAGVLGVVSAYFDLLNGPIPTLLALTILLNHFFYELDGRERTGHVFTAVTQAVAIFACFGAAYLTLTLSRLGLLWLNGIDVSTFTARLAFRTANDIFGMKVSFRTNLKALFAARYQLTPGGAGSANWIFLAGIAAWIFVGFVGLTTLILRGRLRRGPLVDVLVLAGVSLGVLAWYWCFAAHTYVHAYFMVRLLVLPLACGMAAAFLSLYEGWRDELPKWVLLASLCAALSLAALMLHTRWTSATAGQARFIAGDADIASCAVLGLRPDGAADGIIEFEYEVPRLPPLAYLGVPAKNTLDIALARFFPDGLYHTGRSTFVLAIAEHPGGRLLNRTDGTLAGISSGRHRLYAHFCRDSREGPNSIYRLILGDVAVEAVEVQPAASGR